CAVTITARHGRPPFPTYRRMRAAECRAPGSYLRNPRAICVYLSAGHDHAVQMDTRESAVENRPSNAKAGTREAEGGFGAAAIATHEFQHANVKTARSWRGIVALYAPRTGGAYDSQHRTAGIAGRTRRGCRCLVVRCARAATGDAVGRVSRPQVT